MKKFILIISVMAGITAITLNWPSAKKQVMNGNLVTSNGSQQQNSQDKQNQQHDISSTTPQIPSKLSSENQSSISKPAGSAITSSVSTDDENLMLVNKWHSVPKNYEPKGLVGILDKHGKPTLPCSRTDLKMRKITYDAATQMFIDAKNAGINDLVITSAFRSYNAQKVYYDQQVNKNKLLYPEAEAIEKAGTVVAVPGTSEHQTGFALDISIKEYLGNSDQLRQTFADTEAGKWIKENSWKYGFVIRYNAEKSNITGIINEPWHIRYVGATHAETMVKKNMCLEEYLDYLKENGQSGSGSGGSGN